MLKKKIILFIFFLMISNSVFAYTLEVKIPGGSEEIVNPGDYLKTIYDFALMIVGVVAFGALVWGGVLWITSAAVDKKKDALDQIQSALLGLGLVLISYLLLQAINPALLNLKLPELEVGEPQPELIDRFDNSIDDDTDIDSKN